MTVYQMFQETVRNYGNLPALAAKRDGDWESLTYMEYFQQCRAAAKSFLRVSFLVGLNIEQSSIQQFSFIGSPYYNALTGCVWPYTVYYECFTEIVEVKCSSALDNMTEKWHSHCFVKLLFKLRLTAFTLEGRYTVCALFMAFNSKLDCWLMSWMHLIL